MGSLFWLVPIPLVDSCSSSRLRLLPQREGVGAASGCRAPPRLIHFPLPLLFFKVKEGSGLEHSQKKKGNLDKIFQS